MQKRNDVKFDLKISEHIGNAVNHYFKHKDLSLSFSKKSQLSEFLSDYFSLFHTLKKELQFKNLDELLIEIVKVGLADIEKEYEHLSEES